MPLRSKTTGLHCSTGQWNYVFNGAFFSLSDIRAGAVECDLNRPLPSPSLSWRMKIAMFNFRFFFFFFWFVLFCGGGGLGLWVARSFYQRSFLFKYNDEAAMYICQVNTLSNQTIKQDNNCLHLFLNNLNYILILK